MDPAYVVQTLPEGVRELGRQVLILDNDWVVRYPLTSTGRVCDEPLNIEELGSLLEAQVIVEAWRIEYNTYRPHGALGGLTPAEIRAAWITEHQPALS